MRGLGMAWCSLYMRVTCLSCVSQPCRPCSCWRSFMPRHVAAALQVERLQSELAAARESLREAQEAGRTAAADSQRFKEQVRHAQWMRHS